MHLLGKIKTGTHTRRYVPHGVERKPWPHGCGRYCLTVVPKQLRTAGRIAEAIHADGALKRRLMDIGLTKNTNVQLQKVAPLGDPLEIKLRGYDLTLRKSEASLISVVKGEKEAKQ